LPKKVKRKYLVELLINIVGKTTSQLGVHWLCWKNQIFILRTLRIRYMPVFCLLTLGRHGNFTAEVTQEQPDMLCTALALNIELLSIIVCAVLETSY
jgi:hypothetical protein